MTEVNNLQSIEDVVLTNKQKPKKQRDYISPNHPSNIKAKQGEISNMISNGLVFYDMPKVTSDEELQSRIQLYFKACGDKDVKPSVSGMALAIGYQRGVFYDWTNNRSAGFSPQTSDIIKKAIQFMESLTEQMALDGKIKEAIAIFLLKNHHGYKDVNDVVLSQAAQERRFEEIEAKYDEIPD